MRRLTTNVFLDSFTLIQKTVTVSKVSSGLERKIRIEVRGKDEFWARAFHVEWNDQFPERKLTADGEHYIALVDWFDDLERVAAQTFCRIVRSPASPPRREWMRSLFRRS